MVTQPRKAAAKKAPARKAPAKKVAGTGRAVKSARSNAAKAQAKQVSEDREAMQLVERAEEVLAAAGIDLNDVFVELFQHFEIDEQEDRLPVRPTVKNVQLLPHTVVMLEWDADFSLKFVNEKDEGPVDRDMEGFDDLDAAKKYYDVNLKWAQGDVKRPNAERSRHLMLFFADSGDLMDFTYHIIVPPKLAKDEDTAKWVEELTQLLEDRKHEFVFSDRNLTINQVATAAPAAPKQVTGRRQSKLGNGGQKVVSSNASQKKTAAPAKKATSRDKREEAAADRVAQIKARKAEVAANRQARLAQAAQQTEADGAKPDAPVVRKRPVKKVAPAKKQAS